MVSPDDSCSCFTFGIFTLGYKIHGYKNRSLSAKDLMILTLSLLLDKFCMIIQLLWIVFFTSAVIQFTYLLLIFGRLAYFFKSYKSMDSGFEEGVTILVAARNEAANLSKLIPILSSQKYLNYEILVVNDQSDDGSQLLLEKMMGLYPKLRTVTVQYTPSHVSSKKYALTLGIKVAKNDVILLTDADCIPVSEYWIQIMSRPVREEKKTFALGHGAYNKVP